MQRIILKIIRVYQKFFAPFGTLSFGLHSGCRFYPSCSHYTYQAVEKFGVNKGLIKGFLRILKCNPFSKGGIDLL